MAIAGGHTPAAEVPEISPAEIALKKCINLNFDRATFENAVDSISSKIEFPIKIDKPGLQLDGITNCSGVHAMAAVNAEAKLVLIEVLARGNLAGKLVFVVADNDETETIYVTTREGAARRKWKLPPEFAPQRTP